METHTSQSFHKQGLAQIAGVGLRLPQANNIDELADMLLNKKCVLGDPRWPPGLYGMDHLLGCVNDIGMMDCDFFNIPPEEAESCNPMLGPLLEVVTECILDSGLKLCDVAKLKTGFFLGVTFCDTDILTILNTDSSSAFMNTRGELCSRVAQQFDLKGPVMQVDGACASSFAAIHTALIDLQTKRCDLAIVAGSNLILDPTVSLQFSKLNMLSPNGQSCPFDEAANGYVRSDGIAAILLKLPDSVATTRIYCDIVGFGLKADGAKVKGIINPSHKVQTSLLTEVYNKYEIDVNDIAYYEAHGTSTQQGDKAELTSIDKVICSSRQEPLLVGSIKGNIGHTEACAGMAGIMKCLASYKTKTIFSNVNYSKPNSSIKALHTGTIVIPTSNIPLPKGGLMSVSSFGFGGLGGHIVLKQCNQKGDQKPVSHPVLVPLSLHPFADPQKAKDELKKRISERAFYNYLLNSELCGGYTNPQRTFIIAEPASESLLFSKCQNLDLRVKQVTAVFSDFFTNPWTPHKNITSIPAVKISLQRSQESCKERHSGWLFEALASDSAPRPLDGDGVTMRVACQIAIVDLMLELGVLRHFHTIRGVGIGTLAAAYADGVLSQSQCMQAADIIESTLIDENFNQKETTLIQVELEQNELYLLGPWVRIIRKYNNGKTLIAVLQNKGEEVMNLLKSNGDNFAVLDYHISVYTPLPRDVRSNLLIKLRQVIPSPLMWSAKAEITGLKQRGNFIRYCDALFLAEMLTRPYEKFTESASSWSFSLKRKDVLHHMDTFQSDLSSDFKRSNSASDIDFFNSAVNESDERNPACGNQGEYANITSETNSDDAFESITLNFFVDSKQLTNSACPMTPTQETNVVDDSVPKGCDFIPVPPYASGFLSAAGHIHVAGHDVQVSSLFGTEKGNQNTMYCGDFPTHLLWAWEHSAHGIDMDWRMKTKCGKNSKQQPVIEFSPEDYPMPEQLGLGLIAPMFRTVTTFLESELEDGKVLTLDNIKVIELTSEDCLPDEIDKIYGRLFTQSHRFCVERVGHVRVHGYYDVIQNNPAREMKGQNFPYSVTVNKPEEMLRNLFILFKHLFDEISPHRLLWDPMKHDHVLTKAMESMKHQRNTLKIPCSVDTNSGIMMCGGFILHSLSSKPRLAGLPKNINTGSLALASANEITRNSNETKICEAQCAFYECLYQLQPTFLDMTEKNANEERRTPKQVRFSTDTRENEHEVINRPLTPGLLQSFHSVFSSIGSQDDLDYTENASGALSASSFEQKSEVSERDASTPIDGKYLAVALSSVQGDNFRFVDCLDMDEMLTDTLLNMLQLFLPGTTLHVYIAQKKLSSQASPYVLYLFTDIPASGLVIPKVKVLLRDRNTDITEACTSLASAFSVVSTFVDNLYTSYEARVYSVMEVEGQENCPASSWETVLLGEETKMLEDVMGNYEHDVLQCHVPNCLSCMANSNELSSPRFDAVDGSSGCSSQSSSPGKRNSCFCLNLDSMFEKALNKLAVINGHVIAIVKPRDGSKSNTTDTGQLFNKDDPLLMSKNPDGDFTELSKGWGCCKRESHDSVVLNSKDNLPFSPPKLDKGTNKRCGTDKNNERQCQYMISLNKEHKNVVYLYSQANRDVIHFDNVRALLAQLKKWHPQIDVTHEVLVSKLNDNSSFDELLYNFWHSEVNMSDIVMNGTCSEEDKTGNGINGNELPILKGQSVSAPAVQPMLQTPISIVIPEIFITPPLEEKSAKFSELKERMNGSDTNYSEKQEDKQAMDVTSKEMDSLLSVPQDENEIQITTKMPPFNMQPFSKTPTTANIQQIFTPPPFEKMSAPSSDLKDKMNGSNPNSSKKLEGKQAKDVSCKNVNSPSLLKVPQDENEIQITTKMPPFNMQSLGQIPISTTSNKDTDSPSLLNVPQDENEIQITTKMPPFNMQPLAHTPISTEVPQVSITPPLEEKSSKSSDLNGKINGSSQNCSKKLENGKVIDSASEDIKSSSLLSVQQDQCEIQINTKIPPFKIQPSVQIPTSTVVPQISITPPFEDKSSQSCDLKDEINGSCLNFSRRLKNEQMINTAGKDNESPSLLELSQDECEAEISAKMPPVYFQDKVGNKIKPPYFACCDGLKGKKRLLGTLGTRKEQNFKPVAGPDEDCSVEIVELVSESSELVSASSVMSASDMEVCKIFSEESSSSVKSSLINSVEEVSDKNFEITSASIEKTSKDSSFCDLLPDAKVDMCLMVHLIDHKSPVGQQTGRTAGNLLMYVADFEEEDDDRVGRPETQCLGFLLFDELTLRHANFTVNSCLRFEHLESCLEIMVAMYILEELSLLHADDTKKKTVLIQAPIYREPVFVMFLARHLKCGTIITSSSIPAVRDRLQNLIPNIIVLSEPISPCRVLPLTNGKGCDIVVMFNDQATEEYLDLVACSGSLIMCGKIDPFQEIGMSCFLRNISIYSLDVLRVVCHYMTLGLSERQKFEESLLHHLHALGNLVNLEFPAGNEGCFHSVLGRMKELPPLFQPEVNDVIQMFMSMTVSASQVLASVKEEQRQTLQYIYQVMATVFSSDYSVSSSSLQIQCMGSPQKDIERSIFNIPKEALRKRSSSVFHPEDFDYSWNEPSEVETPVVRVVSCDSSVTSLSEAETSESDSQKREQAKVPVLFRRGFQESAALQDIVNSVDGDTIVKLNSCHKGRPFFIVHPVMGTVTCFHALAEKLQIPVCGIQCTNQGYMKCMDGMEALARFYVQELVKMYPEGPVYLGGYSFGTALAYEMAILLEGSDRIQHLLLLDGSLQYIKAHINYEMQFLSAGKSEHQKFVCALLLSFVRLYLADIPAHEASPLLLGSDTQERQIETAADLSLGYVKLGFKFDLKDRWRLVSDKMKKKRRLDSFRKSITCSRSNSISCDTCRLALSGAVDVMHEDSSDGADESNSSPPLGPSDTEACHICGDSQVAKEKSTQPLTEVRKRESICGHNCPEACQIIPELFMSEPACSLADTSDRVMFSLRKRKAERFLQLGLMVENYVPKPLKSVPCSLIRVNSPPPYINLPDLDPQYGMSGLVDDKNFKLLFIEGDHHSCLQHPHVEKLAEMIERLFHA